MAAVVSSPSNPEDVYTIDEWHLPTCQIESFGCGEADDGGQGIQPLQLSGE